MYGGSPTCSYKATLCVECESSPFTLENVFFTHTKTNVMVHLLAFLLIFELKSSEADGVCSAIDRANKYIDYMCIRRYIDRDREMLVYVIYVFKISASDLVSALPITSCFNETVSFTQLHSNACDSIAIVQSCSLI